VSKWAGKFVIGLTGNIGTGKSSVRRMLEHLGAYGIDADALSHRVIARDAPGYQPVINTFGSWVLTSQKEIDRTKLARLVFSDPVALQRLEKIVHPLVEQAVNYLASHAKQPVVVLEAIKLLESNLYSSCDSIWVVTTTQENQINRLVQNRGMSEEEARRRIESQSPPRQKIAMANAIIQNDGTVEETWKQVTDEWQRLALPVFPEQPAETAQPAAQTGILRAKPKDASFIASFLNRTLRKSPPLNRADIITSFSEKSYLLLKTGTRMEGVLGWQVENLVARVSEIALDASLIAEQALPPLIKEMENAAKELQCEAALIRIPTKLEGLQQMWTQLGYRECAVKSLSVNAWKEAAQELSNPGDMVLFKQLRQDRVLRPI
jgi:dephospho-CoA kinase